MSDLPSRATIVSELVRLQRVATNRADFASQFVGAECRVDLYAIGQTELALARGDLVGALLYLRLLSEIGIRLRWLIGDEPDVGDAAGRIVANGALARSRVDALRKRDLLSLAAAQKAIAEANGGSASKTNEDLFAMANGIAETPAPRNISDLATSPTAKRLYAGHRLCSTMTHAGAALGRGELMDPAVASDMVDEASYLGCASADALLRALG